MGNKRETKPPRAALLWDGTSPKVCKCGGRSVAGLKGKHALCKYHWAKFQWGKELADKCYPDHPEAKAGKGKKVTDIGEVGVFLGEPPDSNPYKEGSLMGDERVAALRSFMCGSKEAVRYTYWLTPAAGGARRLRSPDEIDWSRTGINQQPQGKP